MFGNLFRKILGSRNDRLIRKLRKRVAQISVLEEEIAALDDTALRQKTAELKALLASGSTGDDIFATAFAIVREAGKRVLGMRHFDVQLIGAMVLDQGKIAEMRTGEGKTLVATLAVYLNALSGQGVHVVTVNDYLARRDAEWMGRLYTFLGLSVGVIVAGMDQDDRRLAYAADITYGTNNEFGFDYLRDNMVREYKEKVQRGLHYAIIDEVDSILIDEARTPLVISGPTSENSDLYTAINKLIPHLVPRREEDGPGDYLLDEKARQVLMTESGHEHVEALMVAQGLLEEHASLYDPANIGLLHHLNAALRAHAMYQCDVDYIVSEQQIVIIDEFTGRKMPGRRWSDGLHQAIEAKERVPIQQENQTVASITFQNYFRLYKKLAGMTGTADTEAFEFQQIYALEVVVIPTHRKMVRADRPDLVYLTSEEKFTAIVEDIVGCIARQQPVLVGTASIESSERLSKLLDQGKIRHQVLNAKQHEREAQIVAEAGLPGAVTIATNMAGRGTDIVLGGSLDAELAALKQASPEKTEQLTQAWKTRHQQVLHAGGLHIIGTERHESRRIDNQLRGRSGRQGDPGSSRFYLSLQDSLMRIFASERVAPLMQKLGMETGEAIEHNWVSKAIENAQRKVEAHNFDMRKHLLEYDDVANDQRKVVYQERDEILLKDDVGEIVTGMRLSVVQHFLSQYIPSDSLADSWDLSGAEDAIRDEFGQSMPIKAWLDADDEMDDKDIGNRVIEQLEKSYAAKEQMAGADSMRFFEKHVMLDRLDVQWREHLANMDYLRQSVGLRGYAQKNPKQEYKRESFAMFSDLLERIQRDVIGILSKVEVQESRQIEEKALGQRPHAEPVMQYQHAQVEGLLAPSTAVERPRDRPYVRGERKLGRNEPCWCDSGKKYKHCHGKIT